MQQFVNKVMLSYPIDAETIDRAAGCLLRMFRHAAGDPSRFSELLRGLRLARGMVDSGPAADSPAAELQAARALLEEAGLTERQVHSFCYMLLEDLQEKRGEEATELLERLPELAPYRTL